MPKKRYRKKRGGRYRKRMYRKHRKAKNPLTRAAAKTVSSFNRGRSYGVANSNMSTLPDVMKVKLPYFKTALIPGGGLNNAGFFTMSLNCLYDPEVSSGGHQPKGYTLWSGIYLKNHVRACKVTLEFYIASTQALSAGAANVMVGYQVGPMQINPPLSLSALMELPKDRYRKFAMISRGTGDANAGSVNMMGGQGYVARWSFIVSIQKLFKHFKQGNQYDNTIYTYPKDVSAATGQRPNLQYTVQIFAMSMLQDGNTISPVPLPYTYCNTTMQYYSDFFNPIQSTTVAGKVTGYYEDLNPGLTAPTGQTGSYVVEGNTGSWSGYTGPGT